MSIENGKIYKNWKEVCNALGIKYKKSTGDAKKKTIKELKLKYNITKNGYKMQFNKLSTDIIEEKINQAKAENLISNRHNNASKLFQANLIEHINKMVESGDTNGNMNMNMYGLLKKMNMLNSNHKELWYDEFDENHSLKIIDVDVIDEYTDKYYSDLVKLYERGMDNLMKKEILYYEKRHNMNYKITKEIKTIKDEFSNLTQKQIDKSIDNGASEDMFYDIKTSLIKNAKHKMTSTLEETALRNAEYYAWKFIRDLFNLGDQNVDKNEVYNINFYTLFSDGGYYKCLGMRNTIDFESIGKETNLLNKFFNIKEYKLYHLFRELAGIYTGDILTDESMNGYEYEITSYYKAYNIIVRKGAFEDYYQEMIKSVLLENENKDANADYMIQRMYKGLSKNHYDKAGLLKEIVKVCSYVSPKPSDLDEMNKHYKELFNIENVKIDADLPF